MHCCLDDSTKTFSHKETLFFYRAHLVTEIRMEFSSKGTITESISSSQ